MEYVNLRDICKINMGQSPESTSYNSDKQGVPFYQGNADFGALYPNPRIWCSKPIKLAKENDILISVRAPVGALNFSKEECCIGRGLAAITLVSNDFLIEFIYWSLRRGVKELQSKSTGSTFKSINKKVLEEVRIPKISLKDQEDIIKNITLLTNILTKYEQEIVFLDELVKARFVEMFGDPVINSCQFPVQPMTDICDIIDGDRGKNYPKSEEILDDGYCLFLNAKNVTQKGFDFENCNFITREKDDALRNGKLSRGDVVLTTRGTVGNLAYYSKNVPYENIRINSGMVILRMNRSILNEIYFIELFKMKLSDIKEKIASGSAQPQLPISTMNKIILMIPPLELQNQFASFVKEIDKSRSRIQKSLEASQELFDSLMQEYFG